MFQYIITFCKNWSNLSEVKTVLIVAALLLSATGFCIYQVTSEKKVRHYSEIEIEIPCQKEYKKYCLNGGEGYFLVDEDVVASNST